MNGSTSEARRHATASNPEIGLDHLEIGRRARIRQLQSSGRTLQRMLELGIAEGEVVEVLTVAPLGDPIEIRVRDFELSLRKADAAAILVEMLHD